MQQKVKKALSLLLALSMVFSFMVLPAYAAEGDPVEITIRGYELSIRRNEAENILVE